MKCRAVVNPLHVVDSAAFQPSLPTNTGGGDLPDSEQELDNDVDHSSSDLSMATPRETTPRKSTPADNHTNKAAATDDNPSSKSQSEEAPPKKKERS